MASVSGDREDTGYAPDRWAFDSEVARVFDDMLDRSIPSYATMRAAVTALGAPYVQDGTEIVDLGCSRGDALAPFVTRFGARNHYVGVELAPPMLAAVRERFAGYLRAGVVDIRDCDLRTTYPPVRASLTLAVLALMFIPIEYRARVLADVYRTTLPGGAVIVVEKVLGSTAALDALLVREYYALKEQNGYSREAIDRKRLALEGVLVPVTAAWNEELLRAAGFTAVECFYRALNFAGWLALKPA